MIPLWVLLLTAPVSFIAGALSVMRRITKIVAALPDEERAQFARKVMALVKVREV